MKRFSIITALTVLFAVLLTSCGAPEPKGSGKPLVIATTGMVGDLARVIGGDAIDLQTLMGPGVDPHLFKARAGDIEKFSQAQLILYNGLHLEAKLTDVLEKLKDRIPTQAIGESVDPKLLITNADGFPDPHIWFDVSLWAQTSYSVLEALSKLIPEKAAVFQANQQAHLLKMNELHKEVLESIQMIPQDLRVLITAHDAFSYFGRAYGIEVLGLQGISTVSEAGAKDIQNLANIIADRKIPAIFVESSVSPRAMQALQAAVKSRNFEVAMGGSLFSDAMGDPETPEGDYLGMIRHNVKTLVTALRRTTHE